jgi:hypothetical protein
MVKRWILSFITVLFFFHGRAQSIEGVWTGRETADDESCYFELTIALHDSLVTGQTYLLLPGKKFQRFSIKGVFNKTDSLLYFREKKAISSKHSLFEINCFGTYTLHLHKTDTAYILTGTSMNYIRFPKILCAKGSLTLNKPFATGGAATNYADSVVETTAIKDTLKPYAQRKNELITTIISEADTVHLQLYDNGVVDNDTVSLYFNGRLVLSKERLSAEAITVDIILDKNLSENNLLFVAENLGDIPPNTGIMVITTKKRRYEVNVSTDFSTNNSIRFILKE